MIRAHVFARRIAALASHHRGPCVALETLASLSASRGTPSPAMPAATFFRALSSADAATELGSILQREINEEEEAAPPGGGLPEELAALDADVRSRWTVVEGISGTGGAAGGEAGRGATMRMFRKEGGSKGAKIGIVFHCQDTEDDAKFDEDQFLAQHGGTDSADMDYEDEEAAQAVRFGVTVSKGGKTVVMQCRSNNEGTVDVESAMVRDGDAEGVLTALAGKENMHAALYQGPDFTELTEDLQEAFRNYVVKECGVDENVAAYIAMYSDNREQEEYVSWMRTAIDILD